MQVSVESTSGLGRKLTVQVPAAEIDSEVESRLKRIGRTAKIKGFRPGKVPLKVLRQHYGTQARQEVVGEVVQSSYNAALSQEKLNPAGNPKIQPGRMEAGQDLEYVATFEIYPEVAFESMDKLQVERPVAEIAEDDINDMIQKLRKQRSEWDLVEREAADGDRVTVDFDGKLDGESFDGGKAENYTVELGEGRMLADFEEGIKGLKAGESRDITVQFPEDYQAENLRGKAAVFAISVSKVEQSRLPELDDEFVKAFGIEGGGVEAFMDEVRGNMNRELEQAVRFQMKESVMNRLLELNPIEVPAVLVDAEVHSMQHEAGRRMGISDHSKLPPRDAFEDTARKRVTIGLLIAEVIRQNKLQLDAARVNEKLVQLTHDYDDAENMIKMYRSNAKAMGQVQNLVMEEQVVDWLLEQASVSEKQTSFKELMKLDTE
ncbi:MAG: trigger factor [Gammaproteobacteria bacterium]|nr:trigger factor [Gammaproteobacteria bacterium]